MEALGKFMKARSSITLLKKATWWNNIHNMSWKVLHSTGKENGSQKST